MTGISQNLISPLINSQLSTASCQRSGQLDVVNILRYGRMRIFSKQTRIPGESGFHSGVLGGCHILPGLSEILLLNLISTRSVFSKSPGLVTMNWESRGITDGIHIDPCTYRARPP